jgi:hypothetical protein
MMAKQIILNFTKNEMRKIQMLLYYNNMTWFIESGKTSIVKSIGYYLLHIRTLA